MAIKISRTASHFFCLSVCLLSPCLCLSLCLSRLCLSLSFSLLPLSHFQSISASLSAYRVYVSPSLHFYSYLSVSVCLPLSLYQCLCVCFTLSLYSSVLSLRVRFVLSPLSSPLCLYIYSTCLCLFFSLSVFALN
jgi:hypothetical protein